MSAALLSQLLGIALTLAGTFFMARKSLWGPALGALATLPWVVFALSVNAYPMVLFNLVIGALSVRAFIVWRRA